MHPGMQPNDCILFEGETDERGYGIVDIKGKRCLAHRVSMMLHKPLEYRPDQMLCHKCDNPRCINPEHLYYGSPRSNAYDYHERGKFMEIEKRISYRPRADGRRNFFPKAAQKMVIE